MKRLLILISLCYSMTMTGQKIFLDEYKSSIVNPSEAKQYVIIDYENNPDVFKETYFYITGEKKSETNYVKSTGKDGISLVWNTSDQSGKFVKDGKDIEWYINGQAKSEYNFILGKRNGKAFTWFENGQLATEYNIVENKIEGKFFKWYENGQIKSEMDYINNQYNGEVKTYWKNGLLKRKDIYFEGQFKNGTCYDSLGKEIPHFELEQMPKYKGGDKKLLMDISNNTKYPNISRDLGIQGKVVVRFAINEQGGISNIEMLQGINGELNKEAVRVIGTLKKFKPGYYDGEPIEVYYMIPITFTIK